jgi:hypothetical protein
MMGNNGGGIQQSLNMLCDVAAGDQGVKRTTRDDLHSPGGSKRLKTDAFPAVKDNPVLLERLSALGGGFPMPKWGNFGMKKSKPKAPDSPKPTPRIGAFPMPSLKEGQNPNLAPSLSSYKMLWRGTDHDLRKEVLARKLQRGSVKIVDERLRHKM